MVGGGEGSGRVADTAVPVQQGSPGHICTPCAQRTWRSASQGDVDPHPASVTSHLWNKHPDRGPIRPENRTAVFCGQALRQSFLDCALRKCPGLLWTFLGSG